MKIFHASDLHFNQSYFKYISNLESKFDIFCFSGDFLDSDSPLEYQISEVSRWLSSFTKPVFTCSGNHDIDTHEGWLGKITNIYTDNIKNINGFKFGCSRYLEEDILKFADCDILITHIPPAKTKTSIDKNYQDHGDIELYRLIKNGLMKPKIILCGHIHDPMARMDTLHKTTIYNSSSNGRKNPFYQTIEF